LDLTNAAELAACASESAAGGFDNRPLELLLDRLKAGAVLAAVRIILRKAGVMCRRLGMESARS